MEALKESNIISEVSGKINFEYVLNDESQFANIDFKVLQSRDDEIFIKCMKMQRNGKISLFYMTEDCKPLASILPDITTEKLYTIILNLLADLIEVQSNGFLSCENIDISWNKIFIQENTLKVRLVYIPLVEKVYKEYAQFERDLRTSLIKLMNKVIEDNDSRLDFLAIDLGNAGVTITDIYRKLEKLCIADNVGNQQLRKKSSTNIADPLKLVAINAPMPFEVILDKIETIIGRNYDEANVAITFNGAISKVHCKITIVNNIAYVSDMNSTNGTFVNNNRLPFGQWQSIKRGDILRLASTEFIIV